MTGTNTGFAEAATAFLADTDGRDPARLRAYLLDAADTARGPQRLLIDVIVPANEAGVATGGPADLTRIRSRLSTDHATDTVDAAMNVWADARRHVMADRDTTAAVAQHAALAAIGVCLSTYHYLLEWNPSWESGSCALFGPVCSVPWFRTFGFVSLAFMALCGFVAIIAVNVISFDPDPEQSLGEEHP